MKVLLFNGSPHKDGNTHAALCEIAQTLQAEGIDSEIIWLGVKPISGCLGCRGCASTGRCVIDDCVNEALDKCVSADGFIFGTPVHWAGASGSITSFMDRLFYADNRAEVGRFYLKPAAAICVARRGGCTATWDQLNKYFGLKQMPIVTSQYWNMVHGGRPGEAQLDGEGMQTMRTLARNMAFLLQCKQLALQHGLTLPATEDHIWTNFIR